MSYSTKIERVGILAIGLPKPESPKPITPPTLFRRIPQIKTNVKKTDPFYDQGKQVEAEF